MRVLDRATGAVLDLARRRRAASPTAQRFKRDRGRCVVLAVAFDLRESAASGGRSRYAELARALGDRRWARRAPLAEQRAAVLALRRGKGMVVDPDDPDSVSAGSFFTNPILPPATSRRSRRARRRSGPPAWPEADGRGQDLAPPG